MPPETTEPKPFHVFVALNKKAKYGFKQPCIVATESHVMKAPSIFEVVDKVRDAGAELGDVRETIPLGICYITPEQLASMKSQAGLVVHECEAQAKAREGFYKQFLSPEEIQELKPPAHEDEQWQWAHQRNPRHGKLGHDRQRHPDGHRNR
jgi:hypothetical protein